jgi:hypothetical protein
MISYTDVPPNLKPVIYDCFPFSYELDLLEQRFTLLDSVVDRFVISESAMTYQGKPKPLHFKENLNRFQKWLHKVSHIEHTFHDIPQGDEVWGRERQQRDSSLQALPEGGHAWVIISDADELSNPDAINAFDGKGIAALEMEFYYYNLHWRNKLPWRNVKITTLDTVRRLTPCGIRYPECYDRVIPEGGRHCSYFGGAERIKQKLQSFAHHEYNCPPFTDLDHIERCVTEGKDLFSRPDEEWEFVP